MYMDYSKLWKLLIDKGMTKTDLMELTGLSSRVLAKLSKNETVTTDTLARICAALGCNVSDIMDCVSEENLSFYAAFKKLAAYTDETDRYKTLHFTVGGRKYTVYQSKKRANNNTEIQCGQRRHVTWKQHYPIGYITNNSEVELLVALPPASDETETVIVLIMGKPAVIKGLDENGYVSSRGTPKNPADVFVMSEAAFKLFTPPQAKW